MNPSGLATRLIVVEASEGKAGDAIGRGYCLPGSANSDHRIRARPGLGVKKERDRKSSKAAANTKYPAALRLDLRVGFYSVGWLTGGQAMGHGLNPHQCGIDCQADVQ
jgi:hypothetical protein